MYADDTSTLHAAPTLSLALAEAQITINKLRVGFAQHSLLLNAAKTNLIIYSNKKEETGTIEIGNTQISPTASAKFLGVFFQNNMSWETNQEALQRKLAVNAFVVRRLAKVCQREVVLSAYHALFESHIRYSIILWGKTGKHLDQVLKIQKKIIRSILSLHNRESCRDGFKKLQILTAPSLYVLNCLLHVKKTKGLATCGLTHAYSTRGRGNLATKVHRTTKFENSPTYSGAMFFNALDSAVKLLKYSHFKRLIENSLLNSPLYRVEEFFEVARCLK